METFKERQAAILQSFSKTKTWEDKYRHIIQWGRNLKPFHLKDDQWLIRGCQSQVWLHSKMEKDHVIFTGDSDALITKGLLALMMYFYSDARPQDILQHPPYFIQDLDLIQHLTPSRSNGLQSLTAQIQNDAKAFLLILQKENNSS